MEDKETCTTEVFLSEDGTVKVGKYSANDMNQLSFYLWNASFLRTRIIKNVPFA
jgi:hypothetical protein